MARPEATISAAKATATNLHLLPSLALSDLDVLETTRLSITGILDDAVNRSFAKALLLSAR